MVLSTVVRVKFRALNCAIIVLPAGNEAWRELLVGAPSKLQVMFPE